MSQKSQTQGYAQAIYALALEGWQRQLLAVQEKLAASPDVIAQLDNTQTPFADRQKNLNRFLPDDLSQQGRNFFYTLLKNGDLDLLDDIVASLTRLAEKGPGVEVATVTTAMPLSETEKAKFRQKLAAKYGDTLEVDFVVDAAILGGVVIQAGDQIIDGSVASKLNAVQERLGAV